MQRVGIRELRRRAGTTIRRVATGETFEVTDRGRVVALLVGTSSRGLAALNDQAMIRAADGDLLEIEPVQISSTARPASSLVAEGRGQ